MKKRIAIPLALAVIFLSACNNRVASQADLLPTEKQQAEVFPTSPADPPAESEEIDNTSFSQPATEPSATKPQQESNPEMKTQKAETKPPHTHDYTATIVAATCTSQGYTLHQCSCGSTYTLDETAALGHSWGSWTVVTQPTTQQKGKQTRTCSRCGATESQSIPKVEAPALEWSDLDLRRAMAVGNQYAASKYGCIPDNSLGFDGGFDMPINLSKGEILLAAERTGRTFQQVIEAEMMGNVDLFAECRRLYGYDSIENWHIKCWCEIKGNQLWFYVFY